VPPFWRSQKTGTERKESAAPRMKKSLMDINTELLRDVLLAGRRTRPAVFAVEHVESGRRLVIGTKNLCKRIYDQRKMLEARRHYSPRLQADLLECGADGFRFVLLDVLDDPRLLPAAKRLYVEESRGRGCSYHPERKRRINVTLPNPVDQTSAVKPLVSHGSTYKDLAELLERFRTRPDLPT
jgi:hypothetical protein